MLKSLTVGNFKPINNLHNLDLKPITVLAGLNSSGKSTILQSILLISQTLSNPNPEKTLILNGNIIQLGTFDAAHNERDLSGTIELGFTLTPTRLSDRNLTRQRARSVRRYAAIDEALKEIKVSASFRSANPRPGDQSAIEAVRVVLQKCSIAAFFERAPRLPTEGQPSQTTRSSVSAEITPLSQADQSAFLKGVRDEFHVMLPHPDGQNFLLSLGKALPDNQPLLARLYHFLPDRLLQKFNLKERYTQGLFHAISTLADRKDLLDFLPQDQRELAENVSKHAFTDRMRSKLQALPLPKNTVPFTGATAGEFLDWSKKIPLKTRAKSNYIQRAKELVFTEMMTTLYQGNNNEQEWGLESASGDIQIAAIDLASSHTINHFSTMIRYLGPLRADPQAAQGFAPSNEPDDVGFKGEYAAAVYDANKGQTIRWWNPVTNKTTESKLEDALNTWAKHIGVAQKVSTREAGTSGVAWSVQALPNTPERPLQAVGVGVSQVLPILVSGLLAPIGATILIEQPELHLHARAQSRLGDFFLGLAKAGKQCIIETHSDCLVNQLRLAIVEGGQQTRDTINIYFVEQDSDGSTAFSPIAISPKGNIINWPDGFFDENIQQEERITHAAILSPKNTPNQ